MASENHCGVTAKSGHCKGMEEALEAHIKGKLRGKFDMKLRREMYTNTYLTCCLRFSRGGVWSTRRFEERGSIILWGRSLKPNEHRWLYQQSPKRGLVQMWRKVQRPALQRIYQIRLWQQHCIHYSRFRIIIAIGKFFLLIVEILLCRLINSLAEIANFPLE